MYDKRRVYVNMGKFIRKLGFTEETITSEDLCVKMLDMGADRINKLMEDCVEYVETVNIFSKKDAVVKNSRYIQHLRKELKYEKNPMRRRQLEQELTGRSTKRCKKYKH